MKFESDGSPLFVSRAAAKQSHVEHILVATIYDNGTR